MLNQPRGRRFETRADVRQLMLVLFGAVPRASGRLGQARSARVHPGLTLVLACTCTLRYVIEKVTTR